MAQNPQKTLDLMLSVWTPAVEKVHVDVADMQKMADAEGGNFKIAAWDYRYYSEKVRKAKYDLDQNDLKPYLQLDLLHLLF
jgi:peptidyl-dipeptidase Dcp